MSYKSVVQIRLSPADSLTNAALSVEMEEPQDPRAKRQKWARKSEFMLSMLGYIVGLGNIWRFPHVCMNNGGGAFLIPFFICIVLIAVPLFFLELALGQFTARSIVHCWEACPIVKGVGYGMTVVNGLYCVFYVMVITWTLYYIGNSFINPLPWSHCNSWWNDGRCISGNALPALNASDINMTSGTSSAEEFWQYNVLRMSSGIEELGKINVYILICLIGSWVIIFLCLMKGVKSIGKVVYVTATLPYILLTVLLIRAVTLPGAREGVLYYTTPTFSRILDPQVWAEAAVQVFYSTGVCWGPLITMASYNNFNNNCLKDSIILLALGEGTSVFGGFVVFAVLGFMAESSGVGINEIVTSGPGLVYIAYPEAISRMPLPNLWAVLFFLMILSVGLDSEFGTVEQMVTVLADQFDYHRKHRITFTAVIIVICLLMGIPLCFQGGIYLFQLLDWYVAAFCIPIFGLIECLVFGWVYGVGNFSRDIKLMTGMSVPFPIRVMWCFISPILLMVLFVIIVLSYRPPTYGNYNFPPAANIAGMILAVLPILPIPVMAIIQVRKSEGTTVLEKLKASLKPSTDWKPSNGENRKFLLESDRHDYSSLLDRIKWNLFD